MAEFLDISIKSNLDQITRKLDLFAMDQVPFATANTLNSLAALIKAGEQKNLKETFPTATPFTLNSIGVQKARKDRLYAIVYVRDIAAVYLAPFETGGVHALTGGRKSLFGPVNVDLNQYGNLARNKIKQLLGRSDVFIGKVKTKSGEEISGIWQRPYYRGEAAQRGQSRKLGKVTKLTNTTGHLKLLIRFAAPKPVKQHLDYRQRAQQIVDTNFNQEFGKALARALATAK